MLLRILIMGAVDVVWVVVLIVGNVKVSCFPFVNLDNGGSKGSSATATSVVTSASPAPTHHGEPVVTSASPAPTHHGEPVVTSASPAPTHHGEPVVTSASPAPTHHGEPVVTSASPAPTHHRLSEITKGMSTELGATTVSPTTHVITGSKTSMYADHRHDGDHYDYDCQNCYGYGCSWGLCRGCDWSRCS
ncbi:vegetative cell wall protein gp1 isoform X2 [Esox lucius]|uniref:vegetative cell wall protein gp1 isoform X2 n=1 Tax=Esox lucius TaxID=8010 RepID=UPI001476EA3D|nr:vegetative cell wall protein gp1 isoform X2 [Esox lucius]